jgi:TRAP-type C4-dicarboxylate transport system permease small subunit
MPVSPSKRTIAAWCVGIGGVYYTEDRRHPDAQAFNWNQGSAYAFVLLLACIAFVLLVLKLFKVSLGEIAR